MFAAGGTGGHIYPALALAGTLRAHAEILFIGTAHRLEGRIVPEHGYSLVTVPSAPLARRFSPRTFGTVGSNVAGVVAAARALRAFRPDAVVATGGYVCFPVVAAARALRAAGLSRAALGLLEPNAVAGLTNRLLAPLVDEIWTAFDPSGTASAKTRRTGIPVRASLLRRPNRVEAARRLGLDPARRVILAMGGSQGARSINEAIAALVTRRALPEEWQILHVSGERDYEYMRAEESRPFAENRVLLVPYLNDLADAYAVADIVVCRAGASTLGELVALDMPAVLIPYPHASENHQEANARAFASGGGAVVLRDADLNADRLWWLLREAMEPARLARMRAGVRNLSTGDPVATILARVEALVSRMKRP